MLYLEVKPGMTDKASFVIWHELGGAVPHSLAIAYAMVGQAPGL